ncbi:hypothetical protein AQ941_27735 [Burkholderia pseudomallei]|nr:hypothetical protein AQ941_27735 [Burkholderia pseudomallei]ONE00891.1 hypothetical protein AQ942_01970 [Burkholderia pseudomallei]
MRVLQVSHFKRKKQEIGSLAFTESEQTKLEALMTNVGKQSSAGSKIVETYQPSTLRYMLKEGLRTVVRSDASRYDESRAAFVAD